MDRTERLLDLVALLLDAAQPVSFADLREAFPDDYGGPRDAAERKLERDKAELLQLGVPLEFVPASLDDERELGGYRIDRAAFFLPDPRLLPEEAAALYAAGSAALTMRDFPFAHDLQHALRKISLAGATPAPQSAARSLLVVRPGDTERAPRLRALASCWPSALSMRPPGARRSFASRTWTGSSRRCSRTAIGSGSNRRPRPR